MGYNLNLDYIRYITTNKRMSPPKYKLKIWQSLCPLSQFSPSEQPQNKDPQCNQQPALQLCSTAGGSNCRTLELHRSRSRWWRNTSVPVSWRKNHHNQLLTLLTVSLGSTDEVERPRSAELHLGVPILVLFNGVRNIAANIAFLVHLQHWVFPTVIFPHWRRTMKKGMSE